MERSTFFKAGCRALLLFLLAGALSVPVRAASLEEMFPDEGFRKVMTSKDMNLNGVLDEEELQSTYLYFIADDQVRSLKGIEKLISLDQIEITAPLLTDTKLDLTPFANLRYFTLYDAPVPEITMDGSINISLETVRLRGTALKAPLNLGGSSSLKTVDIRDMSLGSLKLANDGSLTDVLLITPKLNSLDLSGSLNLERLSLEAGLLESLDLSPNYALRNLTLEDCGALKELKISPSAAFEHLECTNCASLQELNLGSGTAVTELWLSKAGTFPAFIKGEKQYINKLGVSASPVSAALDLSEFSNLDSLELYSVTGLSSVDASRNSSLRNLRIRSDTMTDLTLKISSDWKAGTEDLMVNGKNLQTLRLEGFQNLAGGYTDSGNWINGMIDGCTGLKKLTFAGDAPRFEENAFLKQNGLAVWYPAGNDTWTAAAGKAYGGTAITWHAYDPATGKEAENKETESKEDGTKEAESKEGETKEAGSTGRKAGDLIQDTASNGIYKVNKDKKTVTFTGMIKKTKKKLTIPKKIKDGKKSFKVTAIAKKACKGCTKLTAVDIPNTVTSIGAEAFSGCKKLKSITVRTTKLTAKKVGKNAFKKVPAKAAVSVPKKKKSAYKTIFQAKGLTKKAVWK